MRFRTLSTAGSWILWKTARGPRGEASLALAEPGFKRFPYQRLVTTFVSVKKRTPSIPVACRSP